MTITLSTARPHSGRPDSSRPDEPAPHDAYSADGHLLLLLVTWWELFTGRPCPAWPLTDAPTQVLLDFWSDPEMEQNP